MTTEYDKEEDLACSALVEKIIPHLKKHEWKEISVTIGKHQIEGVMVDKKGVVHHYTFAG